MGNWQFNVCILIFSVSVYLSLLLNLRGYILLHVTCKDTSYVLDWFKYSHAAVNIVNIWDVQRRKRKSLSTAPPWFCGATHVFRHYRAKHCAEPRVVPVHSCANQCVTTVNPRTPNICQTVSHRSVHSVHSRSLHPITWECRHTPFLPSNCSPPIEK